MGVPRECPQCFTQGMGEQGTELEGVSESHTGPGVLLTGRGECDGVIHRSGRRGWKE